MQIEESTNKEEDMKQKVLKDLFMLDGDEEWMRKQTADLLAYTKKDGVHKAIGTMMACLLTDRHGAVAGDLSSDKYGLAILEVALGFLHVGYLLGVQHTEAKFLPERED